MKAKSDGLRLRRHRCKPVLAAHEPVVLMDQWGRCAVCIPHEPLVHVSPHELGDVHLVAPNSIDGARAAWLQGNREGAART